MSPPLLVALMAGILGLNFFLWKRRGRGWRRHVDDFVRVLQPHVGEPVLDAVVLYPAGAVGRQARAEQGRGLRQLVSGDLAGALGDDGPDDSPPLTGLAVTADRCHLLPVELRDGVWHARPVSFSWERGAARVETSGRALTIQVTIALHDGSWSGAYEVARDPAGYAASVLAGLS